MDMTLPVEDPFLPLAFKLNAGRFFVHAREKHMKMGIATCWARNRSEKILLMVLVLMVLSVPTFLWLPILEPNRVSQRRGIHLSEIVVVNIICPPISYLMSFSRDGTPCFFSCCFLLFLLCTGNPSDLPTHRFSCLFISAQGTAPMVHVHSLGESLHLPWHDVPPFCEWAT